MCSAPSWKVSLYVYCMPLSLPYYGDWGWLRSLIADCAFTRSFFFYLFNTFYSGNLLLAYCTFMSYYQLYARIKALQKTKLSQRMTKPTKWHVRPAKTTQISLDLRPVCSESSLCAQWVAKGPSFLYADSEDSDQTGRMLRLIWIFAGRTCHFVGFVMRWLKCKYISSNVKKLSSNSDDASQPARSHADNED